MLILENSVSTNFSTVDWISISIALVSLIVSIVALYRTCSDINDKRMNDFTNTVFAHLNCIQSVYNDCLSIIDNESIDLSCNFIDIEKDILSDFNFLHYYASFHNKENLEIFSTMTGKYGNKAFGYVFLDIEECYKQFIKKLPCKNINPCDIQILKRFLLLFNELNILVNKNVKSVFYNQDKIATYKYEKELELIKMKGVNLKWQILLNQRNQKR